MYLWSSIVDILIVLALASMVLFLCVNLLRGRPFIRPVTWFVAVPGLLLSWAA